jgi:cystathionine gamma-synthase
MSPVKVISQQPPGGRCTLYARYADAIAETLGWSHRIVHDECRDAHGNGFPSLWIRDAAIQPADGVILSPEDICDFLRQQDAADDRIDALLARLQVILDDFLENWDPGT